MCALSLEQGCLLRLFRPMLLGAATFAAVLSISVPGAAAKPAGKSTSLAATSQLCPAPSSSTLFAPWGDLNLYTPFQGATFESGSEGWSWSGGASILAGDDDRLLSSSGTHAVQVPGGATATGPEMCVDSTMPSMRFFIRRVSGTGSLTVSGTLSGGKGHDSATLATVTGAANWAPTPPLVFPTDLAAVVGTGSLTVQFLFTASPGSTFRIDDIEMDPYRRT
jgi:hypothetical protein